MNEVDVNMMAVKCPLCDFNHNFKVAIKYEESGKSDSPRSEKLYTFMIIEEKIGENLVKVPVYEIDAYCPKKNSPFRMLVNPKIPVDSLPLDFTVTVLP